MFHEKPAGCEPVGFFHVGSLSPNRFLVQVTDVTRLVVRGIMVGVEAEYL